MSYEDHHRQFHERSRVLSGANDGDAFYGGTPDLSSVRSIRAELREYERHGNVQAGEQPGHLQAADAEAEIVENRISEHQRTQQLLGHGKNASVPPELTDALDRAKAWRDVVYAERDRLRELLAGFAEESTEERAATIKKQIGTMKVSTGFDVTRGEYRTQVDGQFIALLDYDTGEVLQSNFNTRNKDHLSRAPKGSIVCIEDEASPFHGMSLQMYRKVVDEVKAAREQRQREWIAEDEKLPAEERVGRSRLSAKANKLKPSPWPPQWPSGSTNYAEKREAVRSSPTRHQPEPDDDAEAAVEQQRRRTAQARAM